MAIGRGGGEGGGGGNAVRARYILRVELVKAGCRRHAKVRRGDVFLVDDLRLHVLAAQAEACGEALLLRGQPLGGVHVGELVVILLAGASQQGLALLQDGGDVECLELQLVVTWRERVVSRLFLLDAVGAAIGAAGDGVGRAVGLGLDGFVVLVGVEPRRILNDAAKCTCCGGARVPRPGAQVRDDAGEEVEELVRMGLLDVGELLGGGVADERGAARLEQAAGGAGRLAACTVHASPSVSMAACRWKHVKGTGLHWTMQG